MEKRHRMNNKGFSMIELVVAIAISVVIISAAYSFVIVGMNTFERTNKETTVQQECTFIGNILGEAVRSGSKEKALLVKNGGVGDAGDILLYLGDYDASAATGKQKKVFYYDKSEKSLYVFDAASGASPFILQPDGSYVIDLSKLSGYKPTASTIEDHLVSKYVTDFNINCITEDGTAGPSSTAYDSGVALNDSGYTLLKVTMTVKVRDRTDDVQIIYQVRN